MENSKYEMSLLLLKSLTEDPIETGGDVAYTVKTTLNGIREFINNADQLNDKFPNLRSFDYNLENESIIFNFCNININQVKKEVTNSIVDNQLSNFKFSKNSCINFIQKKLIKGSVKNNNAISLLENNEISSISDFKDHHTVTFNNNTELRIDNDSSFLINLFKERKFNIPYSKLYDTCDTYIRHENVKKDDIRKKLKSNSLK
jgi:hypothetical protein